MIIRTIKSLEDNVYKLRIQTESFGPNDLALIRAFGEPVVEAGGVFNEGLENEFTLPASPKKLKTGFPITQQFDGNAELDPIASIRAASWAVELYSRISEAILALREQEDTFSSETAVTL